MPDADVLEPRPPTILTERVVEKFFSRVLTETRPIARLTIVAPWISLWESGAVGLKQLATLISVREVRTLILTRPPTDTWHTEALAILAQSHVVQVLTIPDLHAKMFLCEAVPMGFGLVGSANLTAKSLTNLELGVMFDGRGLFNHLLRDLSTLAWQDLRRFSRPYFK
jgi:hypothetical protein